MIELVAAANGTIGADKRRAGKRQVADRIDGFVSHEFIGEAHSLRIEDAIFSDHDRIFEGSAKRVARTPQLRHVAHEAKGPGPRQLAAELIRLDVDRK